MGWEGSIVLERPYGPDYSPELEDEILHIDPLLMPIVLCGTDISLELDKSSIKNIWYDLHQKYKDNKDACLSDGWTREAYPAPFQDRIRYKHPYLPVGCDFRYPVPMDNESISTTHCPPVLEFRAQRAWLYVGEQLKEDRSSWTSCAVTLIDEKGAWAGSLRLNSSRFQDIPIGRHCELIALSLGEDTRKRVLRPVLRKCH